MTFDPFIYAPVYIQIHAAAAFYALVIGPIALHRQRRDFGTRWLGTLGCCRWLSLRCRHFGFIALA